MTLSRSQLRTQYFYNWEILGRGWYVWPEPVDIEPPFYCFYPQDFYKSVPEIDDGKKPSLFDSISNTFTRSLKVSPKTKEVEERDSDDFLNRGYYRANIPEFICEIVIKNPGAATFNYDSFRQFLLLAVDRGFLSFEILANAEKLNFVFACDSRDQNRVVNLLNAFFPGINLQIQEDLLQNQWEINKSTAIIDFGLKEEFMRPLKSFETKAVDPHTGLIAVLENISFGELGMIQIIVQPLQNAWSREIIDSVSDGSGGSFFIDSPDMLNLTKQKVASPLFGVVIRTVVQSDHDNRSLYISQELASAIIQATRSASNSLTYLSNEGYSFKDHSYNVFNRASNRSGMILNLDEIVNIIHLPSPAIVSSKIDKQTTRSRHAPKELLHQKYTIGTNSHLNEDIDVGISEQQRLRHIHIVGATGTGKSTLLIQLIKQDLEFGNGIAVLDPHGDLIEDVISLIPEDRFEDVVFIDPSDLDYPLGLNILSVHSEFEKIVLSSDIVALFKRLSTSWGDQMHSVLANAVDAFLESRSGGTLLELKRFLIEPGFRVEFLKSVEDPAIKYYWKNEFPHLRKNAFSPILTRLDSFLRPKVIRNMLAQKDGLDFNALINEKSIILIKLSHGLIGKENSYLLGSLLVAKLHQTIQARQYQGKEMRSPFYLYIDEFHNFITPSMEEILTGARKYGMGLILAHQNLSQLQSQSRDIEEAIISNAGTRICFKLGDSDARKLEKGFSYFTPEDLMNLGVGQAICRVGQSSHDFNISVPKPLEIDVGIAKDKRDQIVQLSRSKYSTKQSDIGSFYELKKEPKTPKVPDDPNPVGGTHFTFPDPEEIVKKAVDSVPGEIPEKNHEETQDLGDYLEERESERQHIYLQQLIKRSADSQGFLSTIEAPTPDGNGRVDVDIRNNSLAIACEISVTTQPKHELENIKKCLNAGYGQVVICSPDPNHLRNIKTYANENLKAKEFAKVQFLSPEDFIESLNNLGKDNSTEDKRFKGRKVKVTFGELTEAERRRKREGIERIMRDAGRGKK